MALSDEVKSAVSLVAIAAETVTWDMKKSKPGKGDWWAPCPFHAERSPSFHVTEPGGAAGQFYCFGCHAKGSAIDYVMRRDGLTFAAAVKRLADAGQVARTMDPARQAEVRAAARRRQGEAEAAGAKAAAWNLARAREIWSAAERGHPAVAAYLTGRGIDLDAIGGVPPSLRYAPDLPCWGEDEAGRRTLRHRGPAMLGFIGRDRLVGVHRTWIDGPARARLPDGAKVPKAMLGLTGAIFGQPVPLTPRGSDVVVGEGIETTLAGLVWLRRRFPSAWPMAAEAALSLPSLAGPERPEARPVIGPSGRPLPSPLPDLSSDAPGWLPPSGAVEAWVLADPSASAPEAARRNAERAVAKISGHPRGAGVAMLHVPRNRWDHDDDFADLALLGELTP